MGAGKLLRQTIDVIEVPVGLVLVLFIQFILVKAFVIKFARRGCREFLARGLYRSNWLLDSVRKGNWVTGASARPIERQVALRNGLLTGLRAQILDVNSLSFLGGRRMQLGAGNSGMICPHPSKRTSERMVTGASALDRKRLTHDGTALGKHLEVGHAATTRRHLMMGSNGG